MPAVELVELVEVPLSELLVVDPEALVVEVLLASDDAPDDELVLLVAR
jgi:hypothetical protein